MKSSEFDGDAVPLPNSHHSSEIEERPAQAWAKRQGHAVPEPRQVVEPAPEMPPGLIYHGNVNDPINARVPVEDRSGVEPSPEILLWMKGLRPRGDYESWAGWAQWICDLRIAPEKFELPAMHAIGMIINSLRETGDATAERFVSKHKTRQRMSARVTRDRMLGGELSHEAYVEALGLIRAIHGRPLIWPSGVVASVCQATSLEQLGELCASELLDKCGLHYSAIGKALGCSQGHAYNMVSGRAGVPERHRGALIVMIREHYGAPRMSIAGEVERYALALTEAPTAVDFNRANDLVQWYNDNALDIGSALGEGVRTTLVIDWVRRGRMFAYVAALNGIRAVRGVAPVPWCPLYKGGE